MLLSTIQFKYNVFHSKYIVEYAAETKYWREIWLFGLNVHLTFWYVCWNISSEKVGKLFENNLL